MFGSIGGPELILIFALALLLFGPRKLPEIGRMLGKAAAEFRKATQDFRTSLEREVELEKIKDTAETITTAVRAPATLARGALLEGLSELNAASGSPGAAPTPPGPATTPAEAAPKAPAPPADAGHHPED